MVYKALRANIVRKWFYLASATGAQTVSGGRRVAVSFWTGRRELAWGHMGQSGYGPLPPFAQSAFKNPPRAFLSDPLTFSESRQNL